jgi:hypothetical protein
MRLVASEELEALCRNPHVFVWQFLPIGPGLLQSKNAPEK